MATTPVWFITAASSGFGLEMAKAALQKGHKVVATARSIDRIQELATLGADIMTFDVTSSLESMRATAKAVFDKYGRVDYLINAAGFLLEGATEEVNDEEILQSFNINVFGVMRTVKAFLPHIRGQPIGANGKRSTIATFGSLASWNGGPSYSVYAMTKASCSSLAESLSLELAPFNIVSTTIEPGYFRTGFLNSGARKSADERIEVYEDATTPAGQLREALGAIDNNQPGDPVKGSILTVDILTQSGVAAGKEVPVRIVLGTDNYEFIKNKLQTTQEILDQWKDAICSTDYTK
ncbi:hypothetical protein VHEMI09819 [[Torrubiella] hemipterigena]|uniref:NAD(P)-binding protein n=1 Tax=[Torrubiella] hemipterigena TaxID=1531966 RepID=A0A0A1TR20_9HYPO|nr:hypothetical protein VHEMI09819 [[Torrubiella] hemipterigena]